jgi:phosphate transport system substrate-binding protein
MRLSGSNTIGAALAPRLVEAWFASMGASGVVSTPRREDGKAVPETVVHADLGGQSLNVEIRAHGSSDAFAHLGDGSADIGMASRQIRPAEKLLLAALGDMGSQDNEHVIALDGIAVIVAPGRRLERISRQDLGRVFSGEIADWSALGAGSGAIHVNARDDRSGTYDTFKHLVLGSGALVTGSMRFEDSAALEEAVAADPAAIGFIGLPYVKTAHAVPVADGSKAAPFSPTVLTVKEESYALSRRLFLYTAANPANPYVRQFVRFVLSEPGQRVVKATGFVDQNLDRPPVTVAVNDPAAPSERSCGLSPHWPGAGDAYCRVIGGKAKLPTNFRFLANSRELDNRAVEDLKRVLKVVTDSPGHSLTLVGFADSQGHYDGNRRISEDRAEAVRAALHTLGIRDVKLYGFGEELPVADNETPDGREHNRRVEVWMD